MFDTARLDEIVSFELGSRRSAELLLACVAQKRLAWIRVEEDAYVVGVLLNPEELDLAMLLRTVQDWLGGNGLAHVLFEVDGRTYVLWASRPAVVAG